MVLKQDGSNSPLLPTDFRVGLDVGIYGRTIRIFDCDQYTREFFDVRYSVTTHLYFSKISNYYNTLWYLLTYTIEHWTTSTRRTISASRQFPKSPRKDPQEERHRDERIPWESPRWWQSSLSKAVLRQWQKSFEILLQIRGSSLRYSLLSCWWHSRGEGSSSS